MNNKENYTYSDVDSKLSIDSTGNVLILYDEDAIVQAIENIFATFFGEDVRSSLGSRLLVLLGRPIDRNTADDVEDLIRDSITDFEPRVAIERITVTPEIDRGTYYVDINLRIRRIPRNLNYRRRLRALG